MIPRVGSWIPFSKGSETEKSPLCIVDDNIHQIAPIAWDFLNGRAYSSKGLVFYSSLDQQNLKCIFFKKQR